MLALCDIVTPNESEAEALTGMPVTSVAEARRRPMRCLRAAWARLSSRWAARARFTATDAAASMSR
jgi:sugar/nucleoside kinase (ribokinase family)